jgi:hypothetical protein
MNEEPPSKQKLYPLKSRSITLLMSGDNLPIENFALHNQWFGIVA